MDDKIAFYKLLLATLKDVPNDFVCYPVKMQITRQCFEVIAEKIIAENAPPIYHNTGEWEYEFDVLTHKARLLRVWKRANRKDCPWVYEVPSELGVAIGVITQIMAGQAVGPGGLKK